MFISDEDYANKYTSKLSSFRTRNFVVAGCVRNTIMIDALRLRVRQLKPTPTTSSAPSWGNDCAVNSVWSVSVSVSSRNVRISPDCVHLQTLTPASKQLHVSCTELYVLTHKHCPVFVNFQWYCCCQCRVQSNGHDELEEFVFTLIVTTNCKIICMFFVYHRSKSDVKPSPNM